MKYYEMENALRVLTKMGDKKLPRKLAVAIVRNVQRLTEVLSSINEQKIDIAKKYVPIVDGDFAFEETNGVSQYKFKTPLDRIEYLKEYGELMQCEEPFEFITVDASVLDVEGYEELTPNEELMLGFMLTYQD